MSQHDMVIDNGPGINVRLDINQALQALAAQELGTAAPAPTYPRQIWADQSTGLRKKRNTANTAWLADGKLDVATGGGVPVGGAAGAILTKNSAADGDMIWQSTVGFLPTTGGTITGNLAVNGNLTVGATAVFGAPPQINVAAGAYAICYGSVAGARQFYWGVNPSGQFVVVDNTGGAARLTIGTGGNATFANSLTVSGNLGTNQINGTAIIASSNVQVVGAANVASWYYATCTSVRAWIWGANTDGGWYILDNSASNATRFRIDTAGNCFIPGTLNVSGALAAGSFSVSGTLSVAALVASTNVQVSVAAGQNALLYLTAGGQRQWYVGSMNNSQFYITDQSGGAVRLVIDTAGTVGIQQACNIGTTLGVGSTGSFGGQVTVVHGINYSDLGAHTIGFNNAGTTLTFYAYGGSSGSWNFTGSDERLKKNIGPAAGDALAEIESLGLISFDMPFPDVPTRHFNYGFSAQNIESLIPDSVTKITLLDGEERLVLDTLPLLARCVGAIQQLSSRIVTLEGLLK